MIIKLIQRTVIVCVSFIFGLSAIGSIIALRLGSQLFTIQMSEETPASDEARLTYQVAHYNATHEVQPGVYKMYLEASNLPVYSIQAVKLYAKAAALGYAPAMTALGEYYEYGKTKGSKRALQLYRAAAAQGYAPAQGRLALYGILHGEVDTAEIEHFLQASEQLNAAEGLIARGIYMHLHHAGHEVRAEAGGCIMKGLVAYYSSKHLTPIFAEKNRTSNCQQHGLDAPQEEAALGLFEILEAGGSHASVMSAALRLHHALRPTDSPERLRAAAPPVSASRQDTTDWLQKQATSSTNAQCILNSLTTDTKQ